MLIINGSVHVLMYKPASCGGDVDGGLVLDVGGVVTDSGPI